MQVTTKACADGGSRRGPPEHRHQPHALTWSLLTRRDARRSAARVCCGAAGQDRGLRALHRRAAEGACCRCAAQGAARSPPRRSAAHALAAAVRCRARRRQVDLLRALDERAKAQAEVQTYTDLATNLQARRPSCRRPQRRGQRAGTRVAAAFALYNLHAHASPRCCAHAAATRPALMPTLAASLWHSPRRRWRRKGAPRCARWWTWAPRCSAPRACRTRGASSSTSGALQPPQQRVTARTRLPHPAR